MDLAVAGKLASVAVECHRGVEDLLAVALVQAAAVDEDAMPRGALLQERIGGAVGQRLGGRAALLDRAALERPNLGQGHEVRPVVGDRRLDQPARLVEIRRLVVGRGHLQDADAHR